MTVPTLNPTKKIGLLASLLVLFLSTWQFAPGLAARFRGLLDTANEATTENENRAARERFFWEQRTYPNDTIPMNAREQAWEQRPVTEFDNQLEVELQAGGLRAKHAAQQQANLGGWRSIGPTPTSTKNQGNIWGGALSGRITSIAISPADPNIVLTGRGGLWRSTDGGANFTPVIDDRTNTYIHSIAFAPSNPNIVYVGLGDIQSGYFKGANYATYLGHGVLRSNDAGRTWARVSDTSLPVSRIEKIIVDPTNPERVYVGLPSGKGDGDLSVEDAPGFYVSTNGGQTWQLTFNAEITDMAIHPRNPNVLFIGTRQVWRNPLPTCVYQSTDRGLTWKLFYIPTVEWRTNSAFVMRLAPAPSETDQLWIWIAGINPDTGQVQGQITKFLNTLTANPTRTSQVIFRGATCSGTDVYEPLDCFFQFDYDPYFAVDPRNANTLYYGALHVYKSTDGGATWVMNKQMHVDHHAIAFHPTTTNMVYFGNDGGLYKSADGGSSLTQLNDTLSLTEFYQGYALHPTNANISFGGTQDNGQQRRFNTWDLLAGGDGGGCVINPTQTGTAICKYVGSDSFWRYDNYANSVTKTSSLPKPAFDSDKTRFNFNEPFITDGVSERIYFGTYRLLVSDNNADTWSAPGGTQDLTRGGSDTISALAVPRTDPKRIIMTGSAQGRVVFSNNFGVGWLDFTAGLPNRAVSSIAFSPRASSVVYVTFSGFGTGHVYKGVIANNAITWTNISGRLPDIPVNDLLVDPLNPTTLYVATDIGVFRTTNEGVRSGQDPDWFAFNRGLPNGVWAQNLVAQPEGTIQVTTWGRGVYQLERPTSDPTNSDACGLTNIRNQTVNGSVSRTGCFSNTTSFPTPVKRYVFTGLAGQLVNIRATSTAFDAYLQLIGPTGSLLLEDDDSAGSNNPQLPTNTGEFFTLPQSGNYIVEVAAVSSTASGAFSLRLDGPFTPVKLEDGTFETALGGAGATSYVNRITPRTYPATISSVNIAFTTAAGNKIGDSFTLLLGNDANGDQNGNQNIDDTTFLTSPAAIKDLDKFTNYADPRGGYTITSGDFVIGVRKTGNMPVDTNSAIQGRSYFSSNGTNFTRYVNVAGVGSGNFPIRVDMVNQTNFAVSVSAASYRGETLAAGQIVAMFGGNLAVGVEAATTIPLPENLAGTKVEVIDSLGVTRKAPLFFVSPNQINYLIPPGTALGPATVIAQTSAENVSLGNLVIGGVAPGLFTSNADGNGVPAAVLYRVRNGAVLSEPIARFDGARFVPLPLDFGSATDELVLSLFGTGVRQRSTLSAAELKIGGTLVQLGYIGDAPGFVGLDQLNTGFLPRTLAGRGLVNVELIVDGKTTNTVQVNFK